MGDGRSLPRDCVYRLRYPLRIPAKSKVKCQICGDTGQVSRAYVDPTVGLKAVKEMVPCPKCRVTTALPASPVRSVEPPDGRA